jgi:quinol monooxygenase YgiN
MVIVAGHITVDPEQRESYLAGCVSVVEKARRADGCLDLALVFEYDVADVRPLFRKDSRE